MNPCEQQRQAGRARQLAGAAGAAGKKGKARLPYGVGSNDFLPRSICTLLNTRAGTLDYNFWRVWLLWLSRSRTLPPIPSHSLFHGQRLTTSIVHG
jgi:hypothetical protein